MVNWPAGVAVILSAPPRLSARVRLLVDDLGAPYTRSTGVDASGAALADVVAAARAATPSRGVVRIVEAESEIEPSLAAGADEVVVFPADPIVLERALRRAAVRAGVRVDHAAEARMLAQVLEGLTRGTEGPLAAIALDVDALRGGALDDRSFEDIENALEDCGAAVDCVARVLRESMVLLADPTKESRDFVSPFGLVEQILRILGGGMSLKAHVELHEEDDQLQVHAPRRVLARTIAQVVLQALDAVPEGEPPALRRLRVSVRALPESAAISIEVRPGLDAPPPSTRISLGLEGRLAVLRAALRSMDGELVAERATDGGVRMVAFVPRAFDARAAAASPERTSKAPARPRVLMVDADERVLRAAARALGDRFDVLIAVSGEEAIAIVRESGADVAIVDARLPDMSSAVLADELRRIDADLGARLAFIAGPSDTLSHRPAGPVLAKPVRRVALVAAIEALLMNPAESLPRHTGLLN